MPNMSTHPIGLGEEPAITIEHDTFSAAEARAISQAVQAKTNEREQRKVLNEIIATIKSEAAVGKSAVSFYLDKLYAGRSPSAVVPSAVIDGIIENLSSQGYKVGADRHKNFIMVGWGPSVDRDINRTPRGMMRRSTAA